MPKEEKMIELLTHLVKDRISPLIRKEIGKITTINKKYATPSITITREVRVALFLLRVYLILLVVILAYKFFTIVRG